jgi:hypothetical protein
MGSPPARVVLVFAVVASIAACSDAGPQRNAAGPPAPPVTASRATQAPTEAAGALPEILNFSAPRLGGGTIEGADYRGQDLALWFWAPW